MRPRAPAVVIIVATIAVSLFSHLIRQTYPLNVGAYDYPNYVRMMADGTSNLIHASGYPALLHGLLRVLNVTPTGPAILDARWLDTVQTLQNLLHLCLFATSLLFCVALFGYRVTALVALGWGLNLLFVSNVNSAAPEWLQGHALLLSLLVSAYAGTRRGATQGIAYASSAALLAFAYLVKYNSMVMAPALVAFIVVNARGWRRAALWLGLSAITGAAIIAAYAWGYHSRSTGTTTLSFDHTWVLSTALPEGYLQQDPSALGLRALRYVALCALTPPDYGMAGAFPTVDWGAPSDVRRAYAGTFDRVMHASREELIALVRQTPLPASFTNFTSSVPLYYYYGLEKTDRLGTGLYLESLSQLPGLYTQRLTGGLWSLFTLSPAPQVVPTYSHPLGSTLAAPRPSGVVVVTPPAALASPLFAPYYNPSRHVRLRGMKVVDVMSAVTSWRPIYLAVNLACVFGLLTMAGGITRTHALLLASAVLLFVLASTALIGLRSKEVVAITPLYFVVSGVGISGAWDWVTRRVGRPNAS
jgi:hypothetical protein